MKVEKVIKAIRRIRKFCSEQDEQCFGCPIQEDCDALFEGVPENWILEEDEIVLVKGKHNGTDNNDRN